MSAALTRLDEIRQLGVGAIDLGNISASRIRMLATYAVTSKASTLARQSDDQRVATLLCCARSLEVTALDDSLDVLDMLLRDLLAKSERKGKKERLRTLRDLDSAALRLAEQVEQLFKEQRSDEELRAYLEDQQTSMQSSIETIYAIALPMTTTTRRWGNATSQCVSFSRKCSNRSNSRLLQGDAWEHVRATVCQSLPLPTDRTR